MKKISLEADAAEGLSAAHHWDEKAHAELGYAYRNFIHAEKLYEQAKTRLKQATRNAEDASRQRDNVMRVVVSSLDVPSGEWVFDSSERALVRKGD